MATRANIIVQTGPDEFKVIYTHSDGYPSHMGVYLNRFHNSYEAAKQIVENGDMSSLDVRLSPKLGEAHSFDNHAPFCSVFYGRDRGEANTEARTAHSLGKALRMADNEWVYVWTMDADGWVFCAPRENKIGDEYIVTTTPGDLESLSAYVMQEDDCIDAIDYLDRKGMTLEWREAGCPHSIIDLGGWLGETPVPLPVNVDGTVPSVYDHGVVKYGAREVYVGERSVIALKDKEPVAKRLAAHGEFAGAL